jgi:hypothetical protein
MPETTGSPTEQALEAAAEDILWAEMEVENIKTLDGSGCADLMLEVTSFDGVSMRNAFAGGNLQQFTERGFLPHSVAGGEDSKMAWFTAVEDASEVDIGEVETGPDGEYDLSDDWTAEVDERRDEAYLSLKNNGSQSVFIKRDGWTLDKYVMNNTIPSSVRQSLLDAGFEVSDEPLGGF